MDSVTQFVLGAAVGEATLRPIRKDLNSSGFGVGAALLGGLVGTLPDLDVILATFLDGPDTLAAHRGLSHSIFFCTAITPILALLFENLFSSRQLARRRWLGFVWLGLNTHWMLDCFTMYGTQIFQPFSNYPISGSSVFIVDPLYTLTLLAGLLVSLWRGRGGRAPSPAGVRMGLALSTLYLLLTVTSKLIVMERFDRSWEAKGLPTVSRVTVPTPFNSLLWYCYVDTGPDVWVSHSSLFDSAGLRIEWQRIPKNRELLPHFGEGKAGRVLLWFCRGFYRLDIQDGKPVFIDLRFGRMKSWLKPQSPEGSDYVFRFFLEPSELSGPYTDLRRLGPQGGFSQFPWPLWWRRIKGQQSTTTGKGSSQAPLQGRAPGF